MERSNREKMRNKKKTKIIQRKTSRKKGEEN